MGLVGISTHWVIRPLCGFYNYFHPIRDLSALWTKYFHLMGDSSTLWASRHPTGGFCILNAIRLGPPIYFVDFVLTIHFY